MDNAAKAKEIAAMQGVMDRLDPHSTTTSQCCPMCGTRADKRIGRIGKYICPNPNCREIIHPSDFIHEALPEFLPLEDDDTARALTYYHWTGRDNWLNRLDSDTMVHLGSKQAAFERLRDMRKELRWVEHFDYGQVYRVTINQDAIFQGELCLDEENPAVESQEDCYSEISRGYVERYVNVMEAPGSISLCADKTMFTVVDVVEARALFGSAVLDGILQ